MVRTRTVALIALFGLGSLTLGGAAALSMSCCTAACESCPASFCKDSDAVKAPKAPIPALATSPASLDTRIRVASAAPVARPLFRELPSGFVRPMRR
jgi:hypothetical protein